MDMKDVAALAGKQRVFRSRHKICKAGYVSHITQRATGMEPLFVEDSDYLLISERFQDQAPAEVYTTLLDDGDYLCSVRIMYRILDKHQEVKERRKHVSRSHYTKPELLAAGPNQVWSWDITKLKGPRKWTYYYLYVILDIFSRYVPGWMIAETENASLAEQFISETCDKQGITGDQLIIHADRGASMKAKLMAEIMADLGVTKSHSRPYNSNDNTYSEAQFKTVKYCPKFPERFGSIQDARSFGREFFLLV